MAHVLGVTLEQQVPALVSQYSMGDQDSHVQVSGVKLWNSSGKCSQEIMCSGVVVCQVGLKDNFH